MKSLGSRGWVIAGVAGGLLILAIAWLLVISPVRSSASQLNNDTATVQTQNTVILAQNNKLRDQAENKTQLVTDLESALSGLPSGAGLPVFSRQLAAQATARGLTLTGVTIGAPVSTTSATPAAATSDSPDATPTTTAPNTDPSSAAASTAPQAIPITVTTDGPALAQLLFLRDVQQTGPRLGLVTSTALAPAQDTATVTTTGDVAIANTTIDDSATMTLQITVFTNPQPKATRQQLAQFVQSATKS